MDGVTSEGVNYKETYVYSHKTNILENIGSGGTGNKGPEESRVFRKWKMSESRVFTGDKGPNTHWAHCEHIESTGNM